MKAKVQIIGGNFKLMYEDGRNQKFSEILYLVLHCKEKQIEITNKEDLPEFFRERLN